MKKNNNIGIVEFVKFNIRVEKARAEVHKDRHGTTLSFGFPTPDEIDHAWKHVTVDGQSVPVIRSIIHCRQNNVSFGCTRLVSRTGAFIVAERDVIPVIMVDEYFMAAPSYVQRFILAHEAAHIKNGDIRVKQPDNLDRSLNMEIKADKRASLHIGKDDTIAALEWLISIVSTSNGPNKIEVIKELTARHEAIVNFDPLEKDKDCKRYKEV